MRFLLDMGLAQNTIRRLKKAGHDAIHLRDEHLQRLPDDQIVAKAIQEERVILTHDLDFSRIVALSMERTPSVITFRLEDMRPDQVNRYLEDVLNRFENQLVMGALISVNEQGIRVRKLPIE